MAAGSDDPEMIALSMLVAAFSLGWTCYSATASATTATSGPKASSQVAKAEAEDELKRPLNGPTSNKLRSVSEDEREHKVKNIEDPADVDEDDVDQDDTDEALPGSAGGAQPDSRLWFFHVVMAAGALYMAMLLTNWGTGSNVDHKNGTDTSPSGSTTVYVSNSTGEAQMWVKIASQWVAIALYTWTVIAPRCFPDRDFS